MSDGSSIQVTVTHDFICPWCLIGEVRLKRVIADLDAAEHVTIRYRPFELNPEMPVDGLDRKAYRSAKFGSWEYSRSLDEKTVQAAQGDDVAFAYDRIARTPNTRRAHRLMVLAEREHVHVPMSDALFRAYFEQGRDIGDPDTLIEIAAEVGIEDRLAFPFVEEGGAGETELAQALQLNHAARVNSVPLTQAGGRALIGAQPVESYRELIGEALEKLGIAR